MRYTLDTNAVTALLKQNPNVLGKLRDTLRDGHDLVLNGICYYETKRGLVPGVHDRKLKLFDALCERHGILPLDTEVLDEAADLYRQLRGRGELIEDADILVAASAVTHSCILVSRNTKHLSRISALQLENWQDDA